MSERMYPMTAFEEYMFLDTSPQYPMDCYMRLRFSGRFSQTELEDALEKVLPQHPFLISKCVETRRERFAWVVPDVPPEKSHDRGEGKCREGKCCVVRICGVEVLRIEGVCRGDFPKEVGEPINILENAPLRIFLVEEKDADSNEVARTDLIFKFHHSASDALGFSEFISDFLVEYARLRGEKNHPDWATRAPRNPAGLEKRAWYCRSLREWLWLYFLSGWYTSRCVNFVFRRVLPIAKRPLQEGAAKDPPCFCFCALEEDETQRWSQRCRDLGVSLNDALLQAAWVALKEWKVAHPDAVFQPQKGWTRIAVPTNLRTKEMRDWSAANVVSMVFLDRKDSKISESRGFLREIRREIDHIKRRHVGFFLIIGLMNVRTVLRNLGWMIGVSPCWTTMVLTNLGHFLDQKRHPFPRTNDGKIRVGNDLILDEMEGASPIRPLTAFSLCAAIYANRLNLTLIFDSKSVERDLAEDFLARHVACMRRILREE
ncbi:MAG: hypothetical protein Q4D38_03950 [Planctomycetia bacterium]|nr:hypothetical protein [Planctomycetia bacterium]